MNNLPSAEFIRKALKNLHPDWLPKEHTAWKWTGPKPNKKQVLNTLGKLHPDWISKRAKPMDPGKKRAAIIEAFRRTVEGNEDIQEVANDLGVKKEQIRKKLAHKGYRKPAFGRVDPSKLSDEQKLQWLQKNTCSRLESGWVKAQAAEVFLKLLNAGDIRIGFQELTDRLKKEGLPLDVSTVTATWSHVHTYDKRFLQFRKDIFHINRKHGKEYKAKTKTKEKESD